MTGAEFEKAVKTAGYTTEAHARLMCVTHTEIINLYSEEKIQPFWAYALAGIISAKAYEAILDIIADIDKNPVSSNTSH